MREQCDPSVPQQVLGDRGVPEAAVSDVKSRKEFRVGRRL
jgi:hypothetical protein